MLLDAKGLHAGYTETLVLRGVDLEVAAGEVVAVLGPNGAGKTTLLRALSGMNRPFGGRIAVDGVDMTAAPPHQYVRRGIAHVPEGRRMFPYMSTRENLRLGGFVRPKADDVDAEVDAFIEKWEPIRGRGDTPAGQLSGGQQQIVALGRALMSKPRLLLMDEPSMGLAPVAVQAMYDGLKALTDDQHSILLVEQNARHALRLADRVLVLVSGRIVHSGPTSSITPEEVADMYFMSGKEAAAR